MSRTIWIRLLVMLGTLSCRDSVPTPSLDADVGVGPTVVDVPTLGVRLVAPPSWTAEETPATPDGAVRIWAELRRTVNEGEVAPRLVVSSETAQGDTSENVFAHVVRDLQKLDDRPGITVERLGFSARATSQAELGRVQMRYRVGTSPGRVVEHSSLLIFRSSHPLILSTVTGTFVSSPAPRPWREEVQTILDRVEVLPLDPSPTVGRQSEP